MLTWDGTAGATVTYSTTGFAPGDLVRLAVQAPSGQTTGRHVWSLTVSFPGSGVASQTSSGVAYVVARDSSAFGAGWAFSGSDRLITVTADAYGDPAGVIRVEGTGGTDFYAGAVTPGVLTTYTSTNGDTGRSSNWRPAAGPTPPRTVGWRRSTRPAGWSAGPAPTARPSPP